MSCHAVGANICCKAYSKGGRPCSSRVTFCLPGRWRAKSGLEGMVIIGQRSSKSTFSANKTYECTLAKYILSALPQHDPPTQITALHLAAYYSSPEVVKVLVEAGADVNAVDSTKNSALHRATYKNPDVVPVLLEAGAKVNLLNAADHSPLFFAAGHNNNSIVEPLLAAGADPLLGTSPLKACSVNQDMKDYIKSLCKCGEDDENNERKCPEYDDNGAEDENNPEDEKD